MFIDFHQNKKNLPEIGRVGSTGSLVNGYSNPLKAIKGKKMGIDFLKSGFGDDG